MLKPCGWASWGQGRQGGKRDGDRDSGCSGGDCIMLTNVDASYRLQKIRHRPPVSGRLPEWVMPTVRHHGQYDVVGGTMTICSQYCCTQYAAFGEIPPGRNIHKSLGTTSGDISTCCILFCIRMHVRRRSKHTTLTRQAARIHSSPKFSWCWTSASKSVCRFFHFSGLYLYRYPAAAKPVHVSCWVSTHTYLYTHIHVGSRRFEYCLQ